MKTLTGKKTSFTELVGSKGPFQSPVFAFARDRSRCVRTEYVLWNKLWQGVKDWVGYPVVVTSGANKYIKRNIPDAVPSIGEAAVPQFLWCTEVSEARPFGLPGDPGSAADLLIDGTGLDPIAKGKYALVRLQYDVLMYDVMSDVDMLKNGYIVAAGVPDESTLKRYVVKRVKPSARYTGFPRGVMKFVGGDRAGQPIEGQPGFILPQATVEVTWIDVPFDGVPSSYYNPGVAAGAGNIDARIGRVNEGTFAGFTAGTLLLTGVDAVPHVSPIGYRTFDITYMFLHDPNKHNWVLGLSGGNKAFLELSTTGAAFADTAANAGKHIYDAQTMEQLFRPQ